MAKVIKLITRYATSIYQRPPAREASDKNQRKKRTRKADLTAELYATTYHIFNTTPNGKLDDCGSIFRAPTQRRSATKLFR